MSDAYDWECPFCRRHTTITSERESTSRHVIPLNSRLGPMSAVLTKAVLCPNPDCRELYVEASLWAFKVANPSTERYKRVTVRLRPLSSAKQLPSYVPQPIRQDYEEACAIVELAPKASATIARRCLQGMIRDFWGIVDDTLFKEVLALKERVDSETWGAIDAVRTIGNVGAHMEKDINVIVDVDPGEAEALLQLIEMLIEDWYIQRHKRQKLTADIIASAAAKKEAKRKPQDGAQPDAEPDPEPVVSGLHQVMGAAHQLGHAAGSRRRKPE